jgi:polyferredoxin
MTRLPAALVLAVLCVCAFGRFPLHAQARSSAPSGPSATSGGSQWQFNDDDEKAPTWTDAVRSQTVDLAVFAGFTVLALVSFFRKDKRLKYITLAACVVLLGFWKSQLITVVNIFGLISLDLPIFRYSLAWYLLATFTVVSTVLWGRLYCGRMCAFGALTQLMDAALPASWRREPPAWLERRAMYVKYGVLAFAILYFLITRDRLIYRYIEPFWMFGFHGSIVMWTLLGALLLATVFVRNVYCRFLCPVGAALGAISSVTTVFSIKRWKECNTCKICEKACEWGAIAGPKIIKSECVRCDDCERIYADEAKCVHWLILKRKSDFATSRGGA